MTAPIPCNCWLDDEPPRPSPCVFDDPSEGVDDCSLAVMLRDAGKPKTDCNHYREASSAAELTDQQLLSIAEQAIHADDIADAHAEGYPLELTTADLLSVQRAAIAADRRIRPSTTPKPSQVLTDADIPPQLLSAHDLQQQWNQQADEFNQWDSLDLWEQITWAQARAVAADRAARPQPTAEALQAAYAAWFKAEQGIPPSPAAARTAAAFALAVLRGEVQA